MSRSLRHLFLSGLMAMLVVMLLSITFSASAYAEEPESTPAESSADTTVLGPDGEEVDCSEVAPDGVFLGKIVPCTIFSIQSATQRMTEPVVEMLKPAYFAFLTLVIIFFGLRVLQNEPEIYKHGFILIIKIGFVTAILADLGNVRGINGVAGDGQLIPMVYEVMNDTQNMITSNIDISTAKCPDLSSYSGAKLWSIFDCVAGKVLGFTKSDDGKGASMMLMASAAGMIAGFAFGGPWALIIALGMIGVIITLFQMMVRTVVAFVNCYLTICLLLILAPLLIPLMLMPITASYYDRVIGNIMASFLTPVLFSAFAMLGLMMYDKMMFDDTSLLKTLFNYESIKNAMEPAKKVCDWHVTSNATAARLGKNDPTDAEMNSLFNSPFMQNMVMPTLSGGNDVCASFTATSFNIAKVDDPEFKKGRETFEKIFMGLVKLMLLAHLVNTAMLQIPQLIMLLTTKAAGNVTKTFAAFQGKLDSAMGAGAGAARQAAKTMPTGTGTQYAMRAQQSAREGMKQFYDVMAGKK